METKRQEISKNNLRNMNNKLEEKAKDFSTYAFRYYTTQKTMECIFCNKEDSYFFASNYAEMNDLDEAKLHESEKYKVHALCFSNTDNESIPMWYLYSGLLGKGACLRFTPGLMISFLKSIEYIYPVGDDFKVDKGTKLLINDDFELQFGWVYYYDKQQDLLYRNNWYRVNDDVSDFFNKNYFLKQYPWFYEREFRIVIVNKTDKIYKKFAIPINEKIVNNSWLSVVLAPEATFDDLEHWKSIISNSQKSEMNISMSLLMRNKEEILAYISEAIRMYSGSLRNEA